MTWRMYKYSKWYRELQAQNENNLPVTTLLASLSHQGVEDYGMQQTH